MPCKFKIKKGVRLSLIETIVITNEGKLLSLGNRGKPLLKIQEQDIEEDQFFLIHVPRPSAGTLEIGSSDKPGYSFNEQGYLTGIGAMVVNDWLQEHECGNLTCESVVGDNRPQVASKISPKSIR